MGKKNENRKEKKREGEWKGKWKILTRFVRIRGAEPAKHTARTQQTFTISYLSKLCVATILLRPRQQLKLGKSLWEQDEDEDWGGVLFNWKHANLGILHMVAIKWLWKHVSMYCPCLYNSLNSCEYTGPHRLTRLTKIDLPCFFSLRALQGQHRQKWVSGLCIINTFFCKYKHYWWWKTERKQNTIFRFSL